MILRTLALLAFMTSAAFSLDYPETKETDTAEVIHGVRIADPYRWLEDLESDETKQWVEKQAAFTQSQLETIRGRDLLEKHLTRLWNTERFGRPGKEGQRYFYSKNDGLQDHSVIYTTTDLKETGKELLNPNTFSKDGTVALKSYSPSPDGRLVAYAVTEAGSDWMVWKVREIATGKDLSDELQWSKFSGASWLPDSSGFYYGRFPEPKDGEEMMAANKHKKIYFHKIGESQGQDKLVYERPEKPEDGLYASVSEDGHYLIIYVSRGTAPENGLLYMDLQAAEPQAVPLFSDFDASYSFVTNLGGRFFIQTDHKAPMQKLVAVDLANPAPEQWQEVIKEQKYALEGVSHVGDKLLASYLKDAKSLVHRYQLDGEFLSEVKLPDIGTASGFGGEPGDPETFFSFTNFTTPSTIYRYDVEKDEITLHKKPALKFDPEKYTTTQKFVKSNDGTEVPIFIVSKKDLEQDGTNPTLLYGYGGFNVSIEPYYSPSVITWLDLGGIYVVANLRGGSEYGEKWHKDGMLHQKQNVFDDFISAAEWLIEEKYTSSEKLAVMGGSNGGTLVGAVMTQRPDLFGAAIPAVGVMDMLRFHLFTIGWAWQAEYGHVDKPEDFHYLRRYSPLHNIVPGSHYPATLIVTSDHDDRVVPSHSYKFAAALQKAQAGEGPTLLMVETKSGHGAGQPTSKKIEAIVNKYAFLVQNLGIKSEVLGDQVEPKEKEDEKKDKGPAEGEKPAAKDQEEAATQ